MSQVTASSDRNVHLPFAEAVSDVALPMGVWSNWLEGTFFVKPPLRLKDVGVGE